MLPLVAERIVAVIFQHIAPSVRTLDNVPVGVERVILVSPVLFACNKIDIAQITCRSL